MQAAASRHSLRSWSPRFAPAGPRGGLPWLQRHRRTDDCEPTTEWVCCSSAGGSNPPIRDEGDAFTPAEPQQDASSTPAGEASSLGAAPDAAALQQRQEHPRIPWGLGKVLQVMLVWLCAYFALGQVVAPLLLAVAGIERFSLSARGAALLHLGLDAGELAVTMAILWLCLRSFRPRQLGLFPVRWDGARWWPLVAAGALTFPLVDWLAHAWLGWFPGESELWSSALEANLASGDWVTTGAYLAVVGLVAPVWEEAIFRGFLLASLQALLPAPAAAFASAAIFAAAHLRQATFAPLLLLGIVFAAVYQRSRNLLPAILLHSGWNLYVLVHLLAKPGAAAAAAAAAAAGGAASAAGAPGVLC